MNPSSIREVKVVGAGLAGTEVALRLADAGMVVHVIEQKPARRTPAQSLDTYAELVCSNSLRGVALSNAVGLLKEEMRRMGSAIIRAADATAVPAGGALAVDREKFSAHLTQALRSHPRIRVTEEEVTRIGDATAEHPIVIATGPLTGDALATDIEQVIGAGHLAYYDAIAPIVSAESINRTRAFRQSRWGEAAPWDAPVTGAGREDAAYVNCPMDEGTYKAFVAAIVRAEKVTPHAFEDARYFEGCLPVEIMAERGEMTLAFGPMKPVGLQDPRSAERPFAVLQLRQEDAEATAYNMVGFQTRMTWPEQKRIFRMVPGLEQAEFLRFGTVHRNTFVDAPRVLGDDWALLARPHVYLAGQITGVEGYVESAASGLLVAEVLKAKHAALEPLAPPKSTALGGLHRHVREPKDDYQPSNITWAQIPSAGKTRGKKVDRRLAQAEAALADLDRWMQMLSGAVVVGAADQTSQVSDGTREISPAS